MTSHRPTGRDLAGYQYHRSGPVTLYLGDAADVLAAMPDGSVDAVVTSPPFWTRLRHLDRRRCRLRPPAPARRRVDGTGCTRCGAVWCDPQYGLEATVEQYVTRLVAVFDQVRRVLSPTGTCWVNLLIRQSRSIAPSPPNTRHTSPDPTGVRRTAGPSDGDASGGATHQHRHPLRQGLGALDPRHERNRTWPLPAEAG